MTPLMIMMVRGIRNRHEFGTGLLLLVVTVLIFAVFWLF